MTEYPDHIAQIRKWGVHYADAAIRVSAPLDADEARSRVEYMRARLIHCLITAFEERYTTEPPELGEGMAEIAADAFDEHVEHHGWAISGGGRA